MALIQCNFFSDVLGLSTSMTIILPQQTRGQVGMKGIAIGDRHPTLWLLHGGSDDDTIWLRRTSIERYVSELGLAVVMPQVHLSFYTNMVHGGQYATFLMEELPMIARSFFPLSHSREDNFVAGLSMGGYGALKWALTKPDQIAAAAGLSTANFSTMTFGDSLQRAPFLRNVFGEESQEGTDNDLYYLIKQCEKADGPLPSIYQTCGTADFLYEQNVELKQAFERSALNFTYLEEPGTHEWGFWDKTIQDVLAWLPLKNGNE